MHRLDCPITLLDADLRRRAQVTYRLGRLGIHVDPLETVDELTAHWPQTGIILAYDGKDLVTDLIGHMGRSGNWLPLVVFAEDPQPARIVEAILEGAVNYLAWPIDDTTMGDALIAALSRAQSLGNFKLREAVARSRVERLSRREREVLVGVAEGLSNRLIGEKLSISPRTVELHRAKMLSKIGATHTSEAVRIAVEADLIS